MRSCANATKARAAHLIQIHSLRQTKRPAKLQSADKLDKEQWEEPNPRSEESKLGRDLKMTPRKPGGRETFYYCNVCLRLVDKISEAVSLRT